MSQVIGKYWGDGTAASTKRINPSAAPSELLDMFRPLEQTRNVIAADSTRPPVTEHFNHVPVVIG